MVAKKVLVVAEHQEEITCPEDHVQLHKGDDARMVSHRASGYLVLARTESTRCHQLMKLQPFLVEKM